MAPTIKDIAKLANVSHTTVSRALNNSPLIKEVTRKKIAEIASQLNYVPNYNAKSLVLQRSYTIGLFFTSIATGTSSSFFSDTIRGVNSVIDVEYNLFIRGIDDYADFSSIHSKRFDGIILMSQSEVDNKFIYHVVQQGIPIVVLNRQIEDRSIINIISNDREGAFNAGEYLIQCGHKDIAIIEGVEGFKSTQERRDGFIGALIGHGIAVRNDYMVRGNYDMQSGYLAMGQLLDLDRPPTAVFCSNDDMAIGAMNSVFERGLQVPKDISIVGFDDSGFSLFTNPSLTTVKRPIETISEQGAQRILSIIKRPSEEDGRISIKTELIIRKSVRNLLQ
ncbi:LacI family DNA-binding transcriptional regulator [Paenibacillus sp. 19GGS1-52]|uniref:LacI family DNA-binding transcriptional regulator n=1 Tax=Paenibacillus sp. 19GGS1-52 TaxID=2758563 RepID=UPI001EFB82E9|nr:LacI family DNA-binding transcriptional regulator [Paenibacillus sp. 19GGS1-52]ULO07429.1 LacI family DNA-binding transcriptional regulator [Paenibacillus sp. 19GGS1-52]